MKLVSLKKFSHLMDAEVAHSKLHALGIDGVIQRGPLPGAGSLVQGAEIFVAENKLSEARLALEDVAV